jgi:cystathionine beta-lyase/cystathionine gamma-synthase
MTNDSLNISYIINILGENENEGITPVAPPIYQTSNFYFKTVEQFRESISNEKENLIYSRGNNPTINLLCRKLAALEGAEQALVFGSGMAAISSAILSNVKTGDHIVCVQNPYSWTNTLLNTNILPKFGVGVTMVDGCSKEAIIAAVKPETTVIYLESPNSWTFEVQDLIAVSEFARQHGIITIIDNSYCTPLYQQPIKLGIDLVVHTASKYLGGHSDVVAGVCCGSEKLISKLFANEFLTLGGILAPFNAWLILRGLRTLPVRMEHVSRVTQQVLAYLKTQQKVTRIYYPLLPDNEQFELANKQMKKGSGLFTIEVDSTPDAIETFCNNLTYWRMAVSWGGFESLVIPSCTFVRPGLYSALPPTLIRFSVGLEDAETLISDIDKSMKYF